MIVLNDFEDIHDSANSALSGGRWLTYYQYDSQGRLIEEAEPSAVTDYEIDGDGNLVVTLSDHTGLIHLTDYYTTTTGDGHDSRRRNGLF